MTILKRHREVCVRGDLNLYKVFNLFKGKDIYVTRIRKRSVFMFFFLFLQYPDWSNAIE